MSIIAKYKFDQTIDENLIPEFNSEFTYTITDETDTDGYTIRTIESDSLPTLMRFGSNSTTVGNELALLEIQEMNTSELTSMYRMFRNCSNLKNINCNWSTNKVTDMNGMFTNCSSLTSLNVSNFHTNQVTNMLNMFYGCSSLTSLDISNFNTEKVTTMNAMFRSCSSLTSLDLSNFNTSEVVDIQDMFHSCSSLTSLDLSNFNTEKVTNMQSMFYKCSSLTSLDLSNFNTENVKNMQGMFSGCSSLTSLDVSNFNTKNVTNMSNMFQNCSSLTLLDVSNFDTSNVTDMYGMFASSSKLTSLDVSNFDTSQVTNIVNMFYHCYLLIDIGVIYCNSSTINKIVNLITTNTIIWYQDASLSDLTQLDNITYKKYQSTTLSLNEPIQLRSIGDVYDEINYETGEYIQRIGEIVFDGSEGEGWVARDSNVDGSSQYRIDAGINIRLGKYIGHLATDKFITSASNSSTALAQQCGNVMFRPDNSQYDIELYISNDRLNGNGLKQWLSENPITVFYVLAEPIISTVDHTILDQSNNYKLSQQTYDEQTYVSVQSDTVVTPTSSIDYEIYSSTGTITGTSATIENAEAGTPVSGVVYGETLLNVIQEPSETEYVVLGEHSGNNITIENSVAGNVKDAVIKGDTLVNHYPISMGEDSLWSGIGNKYGIFNSFPTLVKGKQYTWYSPIGNKEGNPSDANVALQVKTDGIETSLYSTWGNSHGTIYRTFTMGDELIFTGFYVNGVRYKQNYPKTMILEGVYSQEEIASIPYFEGMQSVNLYPDQTVLKTIGKNLFKHKKDIYEVNGIIVNPTADGFELNGTCSDYQSWDLLTGERFGGHNPEFKTYYSNKILTNCSGDYTFSFKVGRENGLEIGVGLILSLAVVYDDTNMVQYTWDSRNGDYANRYENITVKSHINGVFATRWYGGNCDGIQVKNVQIEQGTQITSHEPHKSSILLVNEEVHLRKIGDVKDELNLLTGELTQYTDEVVLDGSEDWATWSGTHTDGSRAFLLRDILNKNNSETIMIDKFKIANYGDIFENAKGIGMQKETSNVGIRVENINQLSDIKAWLSQNPITLCYQLATPITKTISTTILDQDDKPTDNLHTFDTTTHISTYAQGGGLIPFVNIPENISYDTMLKHNTQYTIKLNRTNIVDGTPLTVNLGGTELSIEDGADSFTITTPSTLTNNTLSIGGANNKVKEVMVIEGDYVDRDLDFFEGFISVENPIVQIYNDNMWGKLILPPATIESFTTNYQAYITTKKPLLFLKPNTRYIINADIITKEQIVAGFLEKTENGTDRGLVGFNITGTGRIASYFDTTNGEVYLNFYPGYNGEDIKMVFDLLEQTNFTVCEYSKYGNNINTVIEKKSNTLTTHPQVTLRSIGDIKDEWDVVGETVTRRIGEVVLDGSESGEWVVSDLIQENTVPFGYMASNLKLEGMSINDKFATTYKGNDKNNDNGDYEHSYSSFWKSDSVIWFFINKTRIPSLEIQSLKLWLSENPIILQYELETPITESVRITPPNPQTSSASITIPTQLNHVEDTSDFLVWNPYKEHYVRYNYVEDGVVLDSYTWENLTDLDERQFVEFYNKRTYVYQPYHNYVASHDSKGTSKYVLIEPNQDYTVSVRFSELPTCETIKVNLGGAEVEMNVNDPHVHVTTPNTLTNNLCSISGDGLDGKVTDILVIHCLEHEGFADIDYFEGIDGIGEIVDNKVSIVMEQTNGNLIDKEFRILNNGNAVAMQDNDRIVVHPNTQYTVIFERDMEKDIAYTVYAQIFNEKNVQTRIVSMGATSKINTVNITTGYNERSLRLYTIQTRNNGSTNKYWNIDFHYTNMNKDYIRPRYYDKEEILLPMQLHRINTVYDNFYYDEMKGFYRIQQSIGHKYFVGADSENWTLIERGQRVLRFRYNNADIQIKSLGEFMTNRLPNGTATSPYECCAFSGSTFIISIDKERLSSESLTAFKEWLANNNLHLYYQLASPLMIDLPEYSSRIEFNTYKDEIYTFFKNCKPTVFTLSVPLDQTYRFYELEQGEGYANRVELTDERMTEEDTLYINTIYGSGIGNLIEEPNNVDTMLKPNYEGKATSHSLTNGKVSTIGVHGFEPNNVTISNYNTVTKQYELTVQAQQGTNTNTKVLPIPYKFEVYEDGKKDKVYYNSQHKQWMFEGGQTLTVPYNESTGAFTSAIEVFRGLQPRSGLIGEFKVRFASGTTSARLYYSINGTTYGYTTLRGMTDEVDYYIGFFNTGGSKIDMGTKIDANAEYTTLVPINGTIPECLMINQIQSITECTYYQDKTYYYSDVVSPLVLDVYNGETIVTELNGAVIDIQNNAHNKQALVYGDTTYTVYWTYVGGEGNIKVTLGGTTQEVVATQGYVTITTSDTDLEKGLFIGGFNVTIKDLMLVKGERITDLKYFEGSRAVGTAFTDEDGNTMYKITFVTGSELINDKFEEIITFEDNKKHNVVVTKLLGAKPDKI